MRTFCAFVANNSEPNSNVMSQNRHKVCGSDRANLANLARGENSAPKRNASSPSQEEGDINPY